MYLQMRIVRITVVRMLVCICHRVFDRDIARAASEGCTSFEALQVSLRVASGCGLCHDCGRETLNAHSRTAVPWGPPPRQAAAHA